MPLGEQQRVAFLRLLLHCPKLAFLDEATGALDTPTEAALYTALRSHCSTFVSVGGRFRFPLYTLLLIPALLDVMECTALLTGQPLALDQKITSRNIVDSAITLALQA